MTHGARRQMPSLRVPSVVALALAAPVLFVLGLGIVACVAALFAGLVVTSGRRSRGAHREAEEWGRGATITLEPSAYLSVEGSRRRLDRRARSGGEGDRTPADRAPHA